MTTPPDPFGPRPFGADPFGGAAFGQIPTPPPILTGGSTPTRPPANSLATLSVIFAFVFAPAGAVLGHLGLTQIRRTGQPGRERALIGLAASYAIIAISVVALAVWATTSSTGTTTTRRPSAAPGTSAAAPPPPAAHVAPADLAGLLPNVTQIQALTGDFNLTLHLTYTQLAVQHREGVIDRAECEGLLVIGDARVYDTGAVRGMHVTDYVDMTNGFTMEPVQAVAAYDNAAAAQTAINTLLAGWRKCGGTDFNLNFNGTVLTQRAGVPAEAGHGITTVTATGTNSVMFTARAIAAKDNVVVDVLVGAKSDLTPVAVNITNAILAKIPDK